MTIDGDQVGLRRSVVTGDESVRVLRPQNRGRLRRIALRVLLFAVVGGAGYWLGLENGPSEPPWPPAEVNNAFWDAVTAQSTPSSDVAPQSDCKEVGTDTYRCYAVWAPTDEHTTFVFQGDVNVYPDGRVVVSKVTKEPRR